MTGFGLFHLPESDSKFLPAALQATLIFRQQKQTATQTTPQAPAIQVSDEEGDNSEAEVGVELDLEQQELERLKRFDALRQSLLQSELNKEMREFESSVIDDEIALYIREIYASVVRNWSRPPSANNEMSARIAVELYPNGELISVGIVKSSGNESFDRSALVAVQKAAPFKLPSEETLYERRFRSFFLLFKPSDLFK